MAVAITLLPKIIEILRVNDQPHFLVFAYDQFVPFAAAAGAENGAPDVVAALDRDKEHVFVVVRCDEFRAFLSRLEIVGAIDEGHYLRKHPDVKASLDQGQLSSGTFHYVNQGYFEQRDVRFVTADDGRR
jgi:hypothetical protein